MTAIVDHGERVSTLPDPPSAARVNGVWQWGRFRHPIPSPDLGVGWVRRFRLKEWHYVSVVTDRLYVALGLVQLGYAANAFLYLVDRKQAAVAREYESLSVLGRALRFAESSVKGETVWRHRDADVRIAARPPRDTAGAGGSGGWDVRLDVVLGELPVAGGFHVEAGESLALLADLGGERPAYTHKAAGLRASGSLRLGDESVDLSGGLAIIDWTRSLAARETRWKWASFAGRSGARNVGLNLSAEVYDDERGDSLENAFWLDGRVRPLGGVQFEVPRQPGVEDWRIRSRRGDEVELVFTPLGARAQHLDLKMVRSDFVQPYGTFRGKVCGQEIDEVFGVVEDHTSVW
ncbi:MAG: DUF2804 domain-containing protein [Myxococcales bacterium]|nr:DUF2804 domain-containing protein [Myxococcales bacterium]